MTRTAIRLLVSIVALGALFAASPAFADALPPAGEDCMGGGGKVPLGGACSLHDTANTPGTCQNTTCSHATNPSLCDADGKGSNCGGGTTQEPCVLCVAGNAGEGDGGSATDGGTTGGKSSSGGCAMTTSNTSPLEILLPLGLAALVPLALRRKKTSK